MEINLLTLIGELYVENVAANARIRELEAAIATLEVQPTPEATRDAKEPDGN